MRRKGHKEGKVTSAMTVSLGKMIIIPTTPYGIHMVLYIKKLQTSCGYHGVRNNLPSVWVLYRDKMKSTKDSIGLQILD